MWLVEFDERLMVVLELDKHSEEQVMLDIAPAGACDMMTTHNNGGVRYAVATLVDVVIAKRAAVEERIMYEGLVLYEIGMHMLMMGPNLRKQLIDAKNQFVKTADETCHSATIDGTIFVRDIMSQ